MGDVYFYHLTRAPLEATLPMLLIKARAAGWRVVIRGSDQKRLEWLDERLWGGDDDAFLPHGVAGGDFDADQPILLATGSENPNRADCLMCIDGADIWPAELSDLARACVLFDGNDAGGLERARQQWKELSDAGCRAQYWSQQDGKWAMKAQTG